MCLAAAWVAAATAAAPLVAQRLPASFWPPAIRSPSPAPQVRGPLGPASDDSVAAIPLLRRPWVRPFASFAVPGSGQLLGGQPRGLVYLATEAWLVARALSLSHEGRRERAAFRELAFAVARRPYASVRTDGAFEYYETMSHFVRSGEFDIDPSVSFAPETDTTTFNGSVWLLARRTFFANPDSALNPTSPAYQAAVAFYASRAFSGPFRWSWEDARLEQDVFRAEITKSDDAFRASTNFLGVVVLNHIVSAVDALIAQRLRGGGARGLVPRIGVTPHEGSVMLAWHAGF